MQAAETQRQVGRAKRLELPQTMYSSSACLEVLHRVGEVLAGPAAAVPADDRASRLSGDRFGPRGAPQLHEKLHIAGKPHALKRYVCGYWSRYRSPKHFSTSAHGNLCAPCKSSNAYRLGFTYCASLSRSCRSVFTWEKQPTSLIRWSARFASSDTSAPPCSDLR